MYNDEFIDAEEETPEDIDKLILEESEETGADEGETFGDGSFSY